MAKTNHPREFPFVFFRHGPWGYPDEIENIHVSLVFAADVPADVRGAIAKSAPDPIGGFRWPLASLMTFGPAPDDRFDTQVVAAYRADDPWTSRAYVQRFSDALDAWLIATHERAPLTCVLGWFGESLSDPWAAWSATVGIDRALPRLLALERDARAMVDHTVRAELARRMYEVVAHRCEILEQSALPAAEQAQVTAALISVLGIDGGVDDAACKLYHRLTGEVLAKP